MTIKVVVNDSCINLKDELLPLLEGKFSDMDVEVYNEDFYKDRKKAIMVKASCGTKLVPFVAIYDKELRKAFYSEVGECTVNNILKYLKCLKF